MLTYVCMPLALLSVLLIDLVFPLIDNRGRLSQPGYVIKVIIKALLFIAAVVAGILFFVVDMFPNMNDFLKVGIFCLIYFAQFLINLDPPLKKKNVNAPHADEDNPEYEEFKDDTGDDDDDDEEEDE